jgi:hypothetical protein
MTNSLRGEALKQCATYVKACYNHSCHHSATIHSCACILAPPSCRLQATYTSISCQHRCTSNAGAQHTASAESCCVHSLAAAYVSACVQVGAVAQQLISPGVQNLPARGGGGQRQQRDGCWSWWLLPTAQQIAAATHDPSGAESFIKHGLMAAFASNLCCNLRQACGWPSLPLMHAAPRPSTTHKPTQINNSFAIFQTRCVRNGHCNCPTSDAAYGRRVAAGVLPCRPLL